MPVAARQSVMLLCLSLGIAASPSAAQSVRGPSALLDRSIARMGGDSVLRNVRSIRLEMITQWTRTSFANRPFADQPSYERNTELRDYVGRAWRNTRSQVRPGAPVSIVDVVRDTIAARYGPSPSGTFAWAPLNVAYVDERRELFAMAPERLVLAVRRDPAARAISDTLIDGDVHARVTAMVDGWPVTLFLRRSDALPTLVRFHADEVADFGLAPWGRHEVEFWYSAWQPTSSGLLLPRQHDVRRVGRPYKRMTLLAVEVNAAAPADSFTISDTVAAAYLATERRPMWQVDMKAGGRVVRDRFAVTPPQTGSPGAVQIGGRWILIEPGQHEGAVQRTVDWLASIRPDITVGGAIASMPAVANGGARWFTRERPPLFVAPGAVPFIQRMTGSASGGIVVHAPRWVRVGTDSLWLEPFDAPDVGGALAIYSPTLRWLYVPMAGGPSISIEQEALVARLTSRGLPVEWVGSVRALVTAYVPPRR